MNGGAQSPAADNGYLILILIWYWLLIVKTMAIDMIEKY